MTKDTRKTIAYDLYDRHHYVNDTYHVKVSHVEPYEEDDEFLRVTWEQWSPGQQTCVLLWRAVPIKDIYSAVALKTNLAFTELVREFYSYLALGSFMSWKLLLDDPDMSNFRHVENPQESVIELSPRLFDV